MFSLCFCKYVRNPFLQLSKSCVPHPYVKVVCNHSNAVAVEPSQEDHEISAPKKRKKKRSSQLLLPTIAKARLQTVQNISSIVISSQELSFVIMNRDFALQDIITVPFLKTDRSSRHAYYHLLQPLSDLQSHIDLNIVERLVLPPKYDLINLHLKSVAMLLIGMFEEDPSHPRVTFACRKYIGRLFDLNIEKTESRKCSKPVVTDIVKNQNWNDRPIEIPERLLTDRGDTVYYTERLISKLPSSKLSPESADALIQAIGFWEYTERVLS